VIANDRAFLRSECRGEVKNKYFGKYSGANFKKKATNACQTRKNEKNR